MKLWHAIGIGLGLSGGAYAQAATIEAYCLSQIPNNTTGLVSPAAVRNCVNYLTDNLSTVPYTGIVSTVYPIIGLQVNVSGTVSATRFVGNGAGLTGIGTASPTWGSITGIPTQVASVSSSGSISLTNLDVATLLRGTAVSVTGNISVNTINGVVPTFGGSPSWYTITNIPTYVQNVSNSGNVAVTNLGASGSVTATNITASGALIGGPTSVTTLLATGLFTGQAGANITGNISTTTVNGIKPLGAWVRFNGAACQTNSSTCIVKAGNVKYVSGTATGTFVVTFNTPLADALYAVTGGTGTSGGNGATVSVCGGNPTSSTFTACTKASTNTDADISPSMLMIQD